jgi:hypothetical protein
MLLSSSLLSTLQPWALSMSIRNPRAIPIREFTTARCPLASSLAARLELEPGAPLGVVDPRLDQASGAMARYSSHTLCASRKRAGKSLVFAQFGKHVRRLNVLGIIVGHDRIKRPGLTYLGYYARTPRCPRITSTSDDSFGADPLANRRRAAWQDVIV